MTANSGPATLPFTVRSTARRTTTGVPPVSGRGLPLSSTVASTTTSAARRASTGGTPTGTCRRGRRREHAQPAQQRRGHDREDPPHTGWTRCDADMVPPAAAPTARP